MLTSVKSFIFILVVGLFFSACSEKKEEDFVKQPEKILSNSVSSMAENAKENAKEIQKEVEKKIASVAKETGEGIDTIKEKGSKALTQASEEIEQKVEEIAKGEKEIDAPKLYKTCATCHGASAEKSALNNSQIIKGWSEEKILESLKGYKDGTYGGNMKALMGTQVKPYSDKELEALAKYISTL